MISVKNVKIFLVIAAVCIVAAIPVQVFISWRQSFNDGKINKCARHLKELGDALEKFAAEHNGFYPQKLDAAVLKPYLKSIRKCPFCRHEKYSQGYEVSSDSRNFTICCNSGWHRFWGGDAGFPRYTSRCGVQKDILHSGFSGQEINHAVEIKPLDDIKRIAGIEPEFVKSRYFGNNALYLCAKHHRKDLISFFASQGVDINDLSYAGETPLHYAVKDKNPEIVKTLLENGADPSIKDRVGNEPAFYTEFSLNPEIRMILAEYEKTRGMKASGSESN